ncbi:MAG: SH3 domain-containing protein [Eubacteriales bacterium]|nr:SH3 domain-containing protein [Eubacteriales bacterium]
MIVQEKKPENRLGDFWNSLKEKKKMPLIAGIAVVVILAIAIVIGIFAGRGVEPAVAEGTTETGSQTAQEENTETAEVPLEEDAHPEINALMEEYYQAVTNGDVETIKLLADSIDDEMLIYLEKRSAYIESYQNLKCYTKAGPAENSYVVYASYEVKFQGVDTLVPGVSPYLVYEREDGSCYIFEGEVDAAVNQYLEEISAQDDVVDLMNRIQVAFNEAVVEDEELNNFLAQMTSDLKVEVGEALAEAEAAQEAEDNQQEASAETVTATEVRATDVVNVRASDSEQAERIGKVQIGDVLPLIESKSNGWSKVEFEGKEAFIKSEYLEFVTDESAEQANEAAGAGEDTDEENAGAGSTGNSSTSLPISGTIQVGDTINVRKSASETADKIGVCYQGDKLEILMIQADGWTKVKFNGQTGYVKTEVLKVMD